MRLRTILIVLGLAAVAAFVALNWSAFLATTTLSLGVATIEAPLGLIMLVVLGAFTLAFIAFTAYMQTGAVRESRRNAREVQAQRELADRAEASRFTELRGFLENQLQQMRAREEANQTAILDQLDRMERNQHAVPQAIHYSTGPQPIVHHEHAEHPMHEPVPPVSDQRHH